jgi:hypothetical protein
MTSTAAHPTWPLQQPSWIWFPSIIWRTPASTGPIFWVALWGHHSSPCSTSYLILSSIHPQSTSHSGAYATPCVALVILSVQFHQQYIPPLVSWSATHVHLVIRDCIINLFESISKLRFQRHLENIVIIWRIQLTFHGRDNIQYSLCWHSLPYCMRLPRQIHLMYRTGGVCWLIAGRRGRPCMLICRPLCYCYMYLHTFFEDDTMFIMVTNACMLHAMQDDQQSVTDRLVITIVSGI